MTTRDDMRSYATFRPVCICGKRAPRFATAFGSNAWMNDHEAAHRATGEIATKPESK